MQVELRTGPRTAELQDRPQTEKALTRHLPLPRRSQQPLLLNLLLFFDKGNNRAEESRNSRQELHGEPFPFPTGSAQKGLQRTQQLPF